MKNFLKNLKILSLVVVTILSASLIGAGAMKTNQYAEKSAAILETIKELEEFEPIVDEFSGADQKLIKDHLVKLAEKFVNSSGSVHALCLVRTYTRYNIYSPMLNKYFIRELLQYVRKYYYEDSCEFLPQSLKSEDFEK